MRDPLLDYPGRWFVTYCALLAAFVAIALLAPHLVFWAVLMGLCAVSATLITSLWMFPFLDWLFPRYRG